tara:strand:+ start:545 stop:1765 length:1221 start_codon:yes stop_codon:yes gene_type:complete
MQDFINRILDLQPKWTSKNNPEMEQRGKLVRNECTNWIKSFTKEIAYCLEIENENILVEGSDGQGNKAQIPWIRFADINRSKSATSGWYVVFLFKSNGEGVYLCLSHASTKSTKDLSLRPDHELIGYAKWGREILSEAYKKENEILTKIYLNSSNKLSQGYEKSTAIAKYYKKNNIPSSNQLKGDILLFSKFLNIIYEESFALTFNWEDSPEIEEIEDQSSEFSGDGSLGNSIGFKINQKQKISIEKFAMKKAKEKLIENDFTNIKDTSSKSTFDYICDSPDGIKHFVEVKGTTSNGEKVILTSNQVKKYNEEYPHTILIIVHGIKLKNDSAYGGQIKMEKTWKIKTDALEVISYKYSTNLNNYSYSNIDEFQENPPNKSTRAEEKHNYSDIAVEFDEVGYESEND